jgi:hypothetical protein
MPSYSPSMRLCATCQHWAGQRTVNPTRAFVSTATASLRGECVGGGHNHHETPATGTCSKHVKWPVLR